MRPRVMTPFTVARVLIELELYSTPVPALAALYRMRSRVRSTLIRNCLAPSPAYVELLMPASIETPANRAAARLAAPYSAGGHTIRPWSSCALFARALWRLAGSAHPILAAPYRVGHAVSDVIEIARDRAAWHEPDEPVFVVYFELNFVLLKRY